MYSILPEKHVYDSSPATATAQLTPNRKTYQLSKAEIEFNVVEEMYVASRMRMSAEKTIFLGKDD